MKIVIACGSGVATSTVIAERVQRVVKENGFQAQIVQCGVNAAESEAKDATLVVTSLGKLRIEADVPVVVAFSYITGMGSEETDAQIVEILKAASK